MGATGSGDDTRLPTVIIPGFMKSGTTSLHRWLESCPEVAKGSSKEPNYFSDEARWRKGPEWYAGQISDGSRGLTLDSSTEYGDPAMSGIAAKRACDTNPDARIVIVVRDPFQRALSHIRHEVQRGRERRDPSDLAELLSTDSDYVRRSCYNSAMIPWFDAFPAPSILVISTESLDDGWSAVLEHLGLQHRRRPVSSHNESAGKARYRRLMTSLYRFESVRKLERHVPRRVRRLVRPLLLGHSSGGEENPSAPAETQQVLDDELASFEDSMAVRGIRYVR